VGGNVVNLELLALHAGARRVSCIAGFDGGGMGIDVNGSSTDLQLWHVEFADGVRTMSVLDLGDAFRCGAIHAQTLVKKTQSQQWVPFARIAGRLAEEEPGPRSERVRSTYPPISVERHRHHSSIPPVATDVAPTPSFPPAMRLGGELPSTSTERLPVQPRSEYRMRGAIFAAVLACALVGGFLTAKATNGRGRARHPTATRPAEPPKTSVASEPPPAAIADPPPATTESAAPVPPPPPTGTVAAISPSADPSLDADRKAKKRKGARKPKL
jgi:hypothetical protein